MDAPKPPSFSDTYTLSFMAVLSVVCALVLAVLASLLQAPQKQAKDLDRSIEMLKAARIVGPGGNFQVQDEAGKYVPAVLDKDGRLVASDKVVIASTPEILRVYKESILPKLVSPEGKLVTFAEAGLNENSYLEQFFKTGYYKEPYKLLYQFVLPSPNKEGKEKVLGYIIPVNGFGLWDAIYGYLALRPNGNTVIGTTWYEQKETPGLGANIADMDWQKQFFDKKIFQPSADGKTDVNTAPLGLVVVRGKVADVLGNSPKAESAVDGMAGATLTGNGVTDAYKKVLEAYRPFLESLYKEAEK